MPTTIHDVKTRADVDKEPGEKPTHVVDFVEKEKKERDHWRESYIIENRWEPFETTYPTNDK